MKTSAYLAPFSHCWRLCSQPYRKIVPVQVVLRRSKMLSAGASRSWQEFRGEGEQGRPPLEAPVLLLSDVQHTTGSWFLAPLLASRQV